jgi:hypothetical protein
MSDFFSFSQFDCFSLDANLAGWPEIEVRVILGFQSDVLVRCVERAAGCNFVFPWDAVLII